MMAQVEAAAGTNEINGFRISIAERGKCHGRYFNERCGCPDFTG